VNAAPEAGPRRWAEPLLLAGITVAGLVCTLLCGGLGDALGVLMLAVPLLAVLRRIARKQESR
jgi:hypothetical protein